MAKQFYTPEEVSKILKVSRNFIYKLIRRGEIPTIRIGDLHRIPSDFIDQLVGGITNEH
ncbi:DNA binding domain-containing protein, excisionase family [Sulfobacillus thermosulfidooxidans DSM 9293]|uniref:DNA binding domain-containing protein, excisionase family n=1 Tax=Sulfobacillus thermosulfidooxidans (strain DSM 9293 / VKM B-1269 / AT-1) TaxID=929705 RepID=A0A1W1WKS5_SULTA|nr:helix-turn-helix domain-containing protein [Sulfobacillus thermosulfidooxidans]SMC06918.1 DNA binding domain-containing protein, excisionase family [Sulfobacillus thermosulfidooxidans DSM 9293]